MARQLGFHVDASHCIGCKTCQVACKDRANLEVGQLFRKVIMHEDGGWHRRGNAWFHNVSAYYISISCNHCEDPTCVRVCPTGAMYKREEDGIVLVDESRCAGCQSCIWACPYDAPQYNPATGKVGKCDFCIDRLQAGQRPVCVDACPFQLISFGDISELDEKFGGTDRIKGLADPSLTKPAYRVTPPKSAIAPLEGRAAR